MVNTVYYSVVLLSIVHFPHESDGCLDLLVRAFTEIFSPIIETSDNRITEPHPVDDITGYFDPDYIDYPDLSSSPVKVKPDYVESRRYTNPKKQHTIRWPDSLSNDDGFGSNANSKLNPGHGSNQNSRPNPYHPGSNSNLGSNQNPRSNIHPDLHPNYSGSNPNFGSNQDPRSNIISELSPNCSGSNLNITGSNSTSESDPDQKINNCNPDRNNREDEIKVVADKLTNNLENRSAVLTSEFINDSIGYLNPDPSENDDYHWADPDYQWPPDNIDEEIRYYQDDGYFVPSDNYYPPSHPDIEDKRKSKKKSYYTPGESPLADFFIKIMEMFQLTQESPSAAKIIKSRPRVHFSENGVPKFVPSTDENYE